MQKALKKKQKTNRVTLVRSAGGVCLLALSASCVPVGTSQRPMLAATISDPAIESQLPPAPPPAPEPLLLNAVPVEKAVALNEAIPVSDAYNPAARQFVLRTANFTDKLRSLDCLTTAIYYEAASESDDGQRAVAAVGSVAGLGSATGVSEGVVRGRLDLRRALRGLARDRSAVQVLLDDGSVHVGTLDAVGADFVELAEHAADEPRRATAVRGVRVVSLAAVAAVRAFLPALG